MTVQSTLSSSCCSDAGGGGGDVDADLGVGVGVAGTGAVVNVNCYCWDVDVGGGCGRGDGIDDCDAFFCSSCVCGLVAQVGDGTTSVVLLAGEILKHVKGFVEDGLHPQV